MSGTVWLVENRAHKSFHRCTLLMLLLWLSGLPGVKGQSTDWQVQTGDWNTASNWSNGVADSLTSATIDNGGSALVLGSASASSVALGFFGDGTVIVNGASSTLTTSGYIQAGAFGTGRLTVENGGAVRVDGYLQMGLLPDSDGTTMVTGTGSSLVVLGDIVAGGSGTGRLAITNGGVATGGGNVEIGFESGGNGTILVSGSGSRLTSDHVLYVGYLGTGSLTVADGAIVQVGGGAGLLTVGSQPGSIGTLNIGNGNSAGTVRAREISGGDGLARVNFNESDQNYIFSIPLTGSLVVAQNGPGKTILTGTNTYTGGTRMNGGTLQVSADGNLGASSGGIVLNGGTLQFGTSFNLAPTRAITLGGAGGTIDTNGFTTTISQAITGTGGLTKIGAGTLTLAGTNSYSGGTVLNAGTLVVNGPQALGLGNVQVNAGILRADPQPINVAGNYTQTGGTLQLQIAGAGQYDFLHVSGNANLGGTLQLISLGYQPKLGDQLTLVSATGSITGRFANWVNPFTIAPGFNSIQLVYGQKSILLKFLELATPIVITTVDFASFARTPNQLAAANLIDAVQLDPAAANLMDFLYQEPFANLPNDFDKISPESLTAFYEIGFSGANIQRITLESRLEDIRDRSSFTANEVVYLLDKSGIDGTAAKNPPMLSPRSEKHWDFWSTSFGDFVQVDSDFNARGYQFTTGGTDLGIDYRLNGHWAFGLMANYAHTWTGLRPGSIDVDSAGGGLYATYFTRCFYLEGGISGGYNHYDSSRHGLQGQANGNSDGEEFSTFVSGGYDFHFGPMSVGPVGSLQYTNVYLNGFTEKGSLAPLFIHSNSEESLRSDVGFRASYHWSIGKVIVESLLKTTWEHEFRYSALPITAGLADVPGPFATFLGPAEGHDSVVVNAGLSVQWSPEIVTYVSYDGQLGRNRYDSNAVIGGVRFSF